MYPADVTVLVAQHRVYDETDHDLRTSGIT